jgi:hypothetical protein
VKITIQTEIEGQYIKQNLIMENNILDNMRKEVISWIVDTREKSIKNALIKLGWTPPVVK